MVEQNKRRFFRIHFKRQVQLDFPTGVYDNCQINNISLGGLFVEGKFPHEPGQQCYININIKSKEATLSFKALAEIVHQDEKGIGLKFISMSFDSLVFLELILLYEPGEDSSDVERKLTTDLPFEINEDEFSITDE